MLIFNLPADSRVAIKQANMPVGWDVSAFLLADIFHAVTGEEHPARPSAKKDAKRKEAARLRAALEAQKRRAASAKAEGG